EAAVYTENGSAETLHDGERYATFASMLDPQRMYVCDAKGRYLGWAPRTIVPTRGDAEAHAKACGQAMATARRRLAPVIKAAAPLMRRDASQAERANSLLHHF